MDGKVTPSKIISKRQARKLIYAKLAVALGEYKNLLKEKQFVANLKKVSKIFAGDFAKSFNKTSNKPPERDKKPVKATTGYAHQSIIG